MTRTKKLKPLTAILFIALSVVFISGVPFFLWNGLGSKMKLSKNDEQYQIKSIVQKGPVKEALKTLHLTELLKLSVNQPQNLVAFDIHRGEELLLSSGVMSSVKLTKKMPDTLEIDYSIRKPIAFLADYSNTVLDENGVIFPLRPYFTPKILPKFYLGVQIEPFIYGKINQDKMKTALDVFHLISKYNPHKGIFLEQIDVSNINSKSLGKQEIVVTFYETLGGESYIRYLRLSKENYEEEYTHFLNLKAMNLPKNLVVDLRMFPNAYLTPITYK